MSKGSEFSRGNPGGEGGPWRALTERVGVGLLRREKGGFRGISILPLELNRASAFNRAQSGGPGHLRLGQCAMIDLQAG